MPHAESWQPLLILNATARTHITLLERFALTLQAYLVKGKRVRKRWKVRQIT